MAGFCGRMDSIIGLAKYDTSTGGLMRPQRLAQIEANDFVFLPEQ
jgi:hypothetical protein